MSTYGPHWYAAVMGTGIVAIALDGLPFHLPGAALAATAFWLLDLLLLAVVAGLGARLWHARRRSGDRRLLGHLDDPAAACGYGAAAMGLMTAGAATGLIGARWLGGAALAADAVLWTAGTLLGLVTALAVPYRAITGDAVRDDSLTGAWLMPVVPPMVSAATGTTLLAHLPAGQARATGFALLCAGFGVALLLSLLTLAALWQRLLRHGTGAAHVVPTVWIVLGPLGQSVTAAHHLGAAAPSALPGQDPALLRTLFLAYGLPVWGFALLWLGLAASLTVRQAREGMAFAPSWWAFTFPVGTLVTGTSALAATTGLVLLSVLAGLLLALLVVAWTVVAASTAGALRDVRRESRPLRDNRRGRLVGSLP